MEKNAMDKYAEFVNLYYHFDVCDANDTDMDNVAWIKSVSTVDEAIYHLESVKDDFADDVEGLGELEGILKALRAEKALNVA